jgi:hypothetical protein
VRYCDHCRNWNTQWPMRCRYCGAGLDGRICRRNHVNPLDPRLAFCGECGEPLLKHSGAGSSFRLCLLSAVVLFCGLMFSALPLVFAKDYPLLSFFVTICLLLIVFRLALQLLPPSLRQIIESVFGALGMVLSGLARFIFNLVFGTGHKGRR